MAKSSGSRQKCIRSSGALNFRAITRRAMESRCKSKWRSLREREEDIYVWKFIYNNAVHRSRFTSKCVWVAFTTLVIPDTLKIEITNVQLGHRSYYDVLTRNILRVLLSRAYGDTKNRGELM